jgi:hypothetical protein
VAVSGVAVTDAPADTAGVWNAADAASAGGRIAARAVDTVGDRNAAVAARVAADTPMPHATIGVRIAADAPMCGIGGAAGSAGRSSTTVYEVAGEIGTGYDAAGEIGTCTVAPGANTTVSVTA